MSSPRPPSPPSPPTPETPATAPPGSPARGADHRDAATPTEYGTAGLYATWDDEEVDFDGTTGEATADDACDFGDASTHPVLKFGGANTARPAQLLPQGADGGRHRSPRCGAGECHAVLADGQLERRRPPPLVVND